MSEVVTEAGGGAGFVKLADLLLQVSTEKETHFVALFTPSFLH